MLCLAVSDSIDSIWVMLVGDSSNCLALAVSAYGRSSMPQWYSSVIWHLLMVHYMSICNCYVIIIKQTNCKYKNDFCIFYLTNQNRNEFDSFGSVLLLFDFCSNHFANCKHKDLFQSKRWVAGRRWHTEISSNTMASYNKSNRQSIDRNRSISWHHCCWFGLPITKWHSSTNSKYRFCCLFVWKEIFVVPKPKPKQTIGDYNATKIIGYPVGIGGPTTHNASSWMLLSRKFNFVGFVSVQ